MAPTLRRAAAAAKAEAVEQAEAAEQAIVESVEKAHEVLDEIAEVTVPDSAPRDSRQSKLPTLVQFPLTVALSFVMASLGYSLLSEVTQGELASVSRSQDTWVELAILAGWRTFELGLGWFGQLDSLDVAMLDLLSHGPHLYLLTAFYRLGAFTAVSALLIDILSAAVPFLLLRPLSDVHKRSAKIANRELVDVPMQLYTTALATAIYTVVLVLSLRFALPRILIIYFSGLPTLEPAYDATYQAVLPVTLVFGLAASTFIFAPFATTGKAKEDEKIEEFDPVSASLGQTVWWNFWGYTAKTKVVIRRTAVAILVPAINTYIACTMNIYGIEPTGAIAYASVWAFAALWTGVGLGFVGSD